MLMSAALAIPGIGRQSSANSKLEDQSKCVQAIGGDPALCLPTTTFQVTEARGPVP